MSEPAFEIRTVAIIGAGPAGRAFAFQCARCGFDVVLEDVMPSNLRRAQDDFAEYANGANSARGNVRYAGTVEDAVRDADLAIDFVPDELESKLEIFSMVDRMAPPRTVLCTPTTALSITDLASCTYRADRCLGFRCDAARLLNGEVDIVRSRFLLASVTQAVEAFLQRIGLKTRVITDAEEPMLVKNARS